MSRKDKSAYNEYQRELMRRRRATPPPVSVSPPTKPAAALTPAQHTTPAAAPGPRTKTEKCFWSDSNICVLYLSPELKPIKCDGIKKACEAKSLADIKTIPFNPISARRWREQ
jgi:hypothetical protein